jgi:hypothetical protein
MADGPHLTAENPPATEIMVDHITGLPRHAHTYAAPPQSPRKRHGTADNHTELDGPAASAIAGSCGASRQVPRGRAPETGGGLGGGSIRSRRALRGRSCYLAGFIAAMVSGVSKLPIRSPR